MRHVYNLLMITNQILKTLTRYDLFQMRYQQLNLIKFSFYEVSEIAILLINMHKTLNIHSVFVLTENFANQYSRLTNQDCFFRNSTILKCKLTLIYTKKRIKRQFNPVYGLSFCIFSVHLCKTGLRE